jgi:D-galactarolactone cycloisomerase
MKITEIETEGISIPLEEEAFDSTAKWSEFNLLLVRVHTDEGVVGVSDIAPLHEKEMGIFERIIEEKLKQKIIGENPYDVERLWIKMVGTGSGAYSLGKSGAIVTATSSIDVALWDIIGKSLEISLYNLLGGKVREEIDLYASFMGQPPVERIKEVLKRGFRGVKVKIGFNVKEDVEYIRKIREELGYDFKLMVDGNQGYDLEEAVEFSKKVSDFGILWLEEPVNVYNFKTLKMLSEKVDIPLAVGENYYMLNEFLTVMEGGTARYIQPDVNHAGGITPIRKISSLAEVYGVKLAPHLHSIVGIVVGLHILIASPSGYVAEYPIYGESWDKILEKYAIIEGGKAKIRDKGGIGVDLKDLRTSRVP